MIHVCYGFRDAAGRYSKLVGTSMLSLFENVPPPPQKVTVHILHDNTLTNDNRDKLIYIAGQYNQIVKFYNVEVLCKDKVAEFRKNSIARTRWSIGSVYPLLVADVVPKDVKKIIYLDADTIVNLDIGELWQVDISDKTLAVIPHVLQMKRRYHLADIVKNEDYFNGGVYMVNVEKFIAQSAVIEEGKKFLLQNEQYKNSLNDELWLNYCFSTDTVKLPLKFNFMLNYQRGKSFDVEDKIIHYASYTFGMDVHDVWNKEFFKYFVKTPWFNQDMFVNLYEGIQKLYNDQKNIMLNVANALSGKQRVFCLSANNVEKSKKIFAIKDNETIFNADISDPAVMFKLTLLAKENKDKATLIFVTDGYIHMKIHLVKQGYREWQDFIDGTVIFSEQNGGTLNTSHIVANM